MYKYLVYYQVGFKNLATYKADFIIHIIANMVFFFIYFALWKSIYSTTGTAEINTYSLSNTITYFFITSILFRFEPTFAMYLNESIWDGYLTNDLVRPWSAIAADIIFTIAEVSLRVLLYLPFCLFIFLVAANYIDLPTFANLFYFLITVIFGLFMSIAFYEIIHALCFYFGDQEANINLISYIVVFLAGGFFPLLFLPQALQSFFHLLPFRFLFDVPANIFLGKFSFLEILGIWTQMIAWTVGFFAIFMFLFKNGLKRYTGTGR